MLPLLLATLYLCWGSSFLGIELMVRDIPPLLGSGIRFTLAGVLLTLAILPRRGWRAVLPRRRDLPAVIGLSILLITIGNGGVVLAQDQGIPSWLAALLVATIPVWIALMRLGWGPRPSRFTLWGTGIGLIGTVFLVSTSGLRITGIVPLLLALTGALSWSIGAFVATRRGGAEDPFVTTLRQLVIGGSGLLVLAFLVERGSWDQTRWTPSAVGGLLSVLTPLVRNVADFVTENKALVGNLVVVTGGLFAARLAVLAGAFAFTFLKGAVLAVGAAMMANPIGLAVRGIALAATLIYTYWGPIKDWFAQLWASVKATFAGVYDWIVGKVGYLLELPGRVKDKVGSVLGIGSYSSMPSGGTMDGFEPPGASLPDVPAIASRGGSTTVQDNSQHTYQITQQPGQDAKALAAEIERLQRRGAGVRARSSLVDGVGAQ